MLCLSRTVCVLSIRSSLFHLIRVLFVFVIRMCFIIAECMYFMLSFHIPFQRFSFPVTACLTFNCSKARSITVGFQIIGTATVLRNLYTHTPLRCCCKRDSN